MGQFSMEISCAAGAVLSGTQQTTLLGRAYDAPFGIALMAYRGDILLAQAAERCGIPMMTSGSSLIRLEDIVAAAGF